ncbi:AAA family ATPase [Sphingomonas oligophenolica]|nr:AAA family ATPase [Sphingomonas oligophenolica]
MTENYYSVMRRYDEDGEPTFRYCIPSTAYIRPCAKIAGDAASDGAGLNSIADRYAALTTELPLAGAAIMGNDASGEIALIARLRAAAPWLEPAIASIERHLLIQNWAGRPWIAWRPLCLVGPPGCGKSYFARLIAEATDAGSGVLDLAGTSDNRTLEGTARGWTSAQPCWPALMMSQARTVNPVLVLEEVEKFAGDGQNGNPLATLLTMIEAETAKHYWDRCLLAEIDLSHICWILTCNDSAMLPAVLRARLDIITVEGPGIEHFDVLYTTIGSNLAKRWGVPAAAIPALPPRAIRVLRATFAQKRSVRSLRQNIEQLMAAAIPRDRGPTH